MIELTCFFMEDYNKGEFVIMDTSGNIICSDSKQFYVLQKYFAKHTTKEIYFRGQTHGHDLLPSIMRSSYNNLYSNYNEYIQRVEIEHSIELEDCGKSKLRKLSKMQHYGFPTNLLDISTNPYKALGFMIEFPKEPKNDSEKYDENNPSCIYVIKPKKDTKLLSLSASHNPETICTLVPNNNQIDNIRLHAQSGLFIYAPTNIAPSEYLNKLLEHYEITKITVKFHKEELINEMIEKLEQYHYGLNDLYPDMIKRAEYYKHYWKK